MNKKIKAFFVIGMLMILALALTGCDKLSRKEQSELEETKMKALVYYNDKYDLTENVVEYNYNYYGDMFGTSYDRSIMYFIMSDGYIVVYDVKKDRMLDNKQSQEIIDAINEAVWLKCFAQVEVITGGEMYCGRIDNIRYNYYRAGDSNSVNAFTEYYDGDIEAFLAKENIKLNAGNPDMIIVCDDESWEEAAEYLKAEIDNYFDEYRVSSIEVMNRELYNDSKDKNGSFYGHKGYVARVRLERNESHEEFIVDEPTFVQACPGIYMTTNEWGFQFQEGDVILEEFTDENGLQQICDNDYSKWVDNGSDESNSRNFDRTPIEVTVEGKVYRIRFSDRVKDYMKSQDRGFVQVEIRVVPEELDTNTTKRLCTINNGGADVHDIVKKDFYSADWTKDLDATIGFSTSENELFYFGEYRSGK